MAIKQIEYLIEGLLPTKRIHLIAGPSGAGKTRWLLPAIDDWSHGRSVLDRASFPKKFGYLACDRTSDSAIETMQSMDLDPDEFLIRSMMDKTDTEPTLGAAMKLFPDDVRVLFIEAFAIFVEKGNDYRQVWQFFRNANKLCSARDLTIIGTVHTAKMKEDQKFIHPRERILGSAAWGACSDTVICLDPMPSKPGTPDDGRRLFTLMPRHEAPQELVYEFDNKGKLVPCTETQDITKFLLDKELALHPAGEQFTTEKIQEWADRHKCSRRTVERWINEQVNLGAINRVARGTYVKPHKN